MILTGQICAHDFINRMTVGLLRKCAYVGPAQSQLARLFTHPAIGWKFLKFLALPKVKISNPREETDEELRRIWLPNVTLKGHVW